MDIVAVVVIAFAVAFVVSVVDYWADLGIFRAGVALGLAMIGVAPLGLSWAAGLTCALAASFLAMFLLQVVERINFRSGRTR